MNQLVNFLSGLLFALGLGTAQMTQPQKITSFLNVFGDWDPSMLVVMLGAVVVYFIAHQVILRRAVPVFGNRFQLPTRREIDRPLVVGSVLFGLGWGMVGFCPAPAITAAVTGHESVLIFVLAMATGMYAFEVLDVRFSLEPDGGAGMLTAHNQTVDSK